MSIVAYRDRTTGEYPLSIADVQRRVDRLFDHANPSPAILDAANVDPVDATNQPTPGDGQTVREAAPEKLGSVWQQTWVIEDLPVQPEVFGSISDRQFFQALATPPYSLISTQEALDAVKTGEIPAVMQTVINGMPDDQQFAATMLISGATVFDRSNPLVTTFGASQGMDSAAIDAFWRTAEAI